MAMTQDLGVKMAHTTIYSSYQPPILHWLHELFVQKKNEKMANECIHFLEGGVPYLFLQNKTHIKTHYESSLRKVSQTPPPGPY